MVSSRGGGGSAPLKQRLSVGNSVDKVVSAYLHYVISFQNEIQDYYGRDISKQN